MKTINPHSQEFLQKRKLFMALPILVLPFLTVMFWALGGGQGTTVQAKPTGLAGLNYELPDAQFAEKEIWDKLALYEIAARDSSKYEEARESDPYFDLVAFKTTHEEPDDTTKDNLMKAFRQKDRLATDPNEEMVNKKIEELYREINKPAALPSTTSPRTAVSSTPDPRFSEDVDRLEQLMESMQDPEAKNQEMEHMERVLEKILDIQHPERVKEKMEKETSEPAVWAVETAGDGTAITLLDTISVTPATDNANMDITPSSISVTNGFFGLEEEQYIDRKGSAFEAVIHDTQELVAGSTVKMRIRHDVMVNGHPVPKDQLIFGTCAINGERMTIEVNSIRSGNSILPVALSVYDLDGLQGIYIPGAITRDAAKQASDNALQNVQMMSINPSLSAQAAAAGVEAAKGLFSKKAKLVKVTVKAGYQVLLVDGSPATQPNL